MNTDTRQQIADLLHAGHSDLDIHRRTGAARTTIARHRKQLGLPGYHTTADSPACRHGHRFPENRRWNENGHLICLACRRSRDRARSQPVPRQPGQPGQRQRLWEPVQPDPIAIERAIAGDAPDRLTPRERHAAIARLDRREYSAAVIAERVRCSKRTVHRARSKAAAYPRT